MRVRTLLLYLTGSRRAIVELAADRGAVWPGLLFVLSAGLAREYDGQDLLREPWHLLVPFAASLAMSLLVFMAAFGRLYLRREGRPPFRAAYRSFLALFWLTAPLAWLYAIPYERFLPPGQAAGANLWTLALVALWRVLLITRVVSVLSGRGFLASLFLVMAFADAAALTAVGLMPRPVVSVMGGVRPSEQEAVVGGATFLVSCLGSLSAPVWAVGGLIVLLKGRPAWQVPAEPADSPRRGLWVLAVASVLVWGPILPFTQAEQRLRSQAEADLRGGRIAEGLDLMSAHDPTDFPPHWDPPPRIGYRETSPDLLVVMDVLLSRPCAPWVRECYVDKLRRWLGDEWAFLYFPRGGPELARLVRVLRQLPEGRELATVCARGAESRLGQKDTPAEERENLKALLELAGKPADRTGQ